MNILITDDNPINLKLLRVVLEAEGHDVYDAADGVEALEILNRETVDAVISDILMPRMDGYRLCQEVRQSEPLKHLPFIFYTATYTSPSDEGLALKVGADGYLRKPASGADLFAALRKVTAEPRRKLPEVSIESPVVMKEYNEALVRKLEQKNTELEVAQAAIVKTNEELEERVKERTAQLEAANAELEAFSHSAAHDLRSPLRAISGYCQMLLEDAGDQLGDDGADYLHRIKDSTRKMNDLIEELLKLSYIGRCEIGSRSVDLSALVTEVGEDLRRLNPEQSVELVVAPGIVTDGDEPLLRIAFQNLLNNAWKFTSKQEHSRVEFGRLPGSRQDICFVRDNGPGFDMAYEDKLFSAFQRMHTQAEYPGTGLGLTIVQRIVIRHGGQVWAESKPGQGATFFLKFDSLCSLP